MTIPWIVTSILYIEGSFGALAVFAFLVTRGQRAPTSREVGWAILWVFLWPILTPLFVAKVLINLFKE